MASDGVDPLIAAVYSTHMGTVGMSFPAVSIGLSAVEGELVSGKSSPIGPVIDMMISVDLRIHVGYPNVFHDEIKFMRLANSVVNWMESHRDLQTTGVKLETVFQTVSDETFEDTGTIGGTVSFVIRITEDYVKL